MGKTLYVSIDAGYDGYKIAVNDCWYRFSSKMLEVNDATYATKGRPADSVYIRVEGREFIFGDIADISMRSSDIVKNNDKLLDEINSRGRFQGIYFRYSIQAALAYSLYMYENDSENKINFKIDQLDDYEVKIGVALPHDMVDDNWPTVKSYLLCKHDFKLYVSNDKKEINITYDLKKASAMVGSQVICSYLYQATDDNCSDIEEELENLPCIVCDGGYKTFGYFYLDVGLMMSNGESNTRFAMNNIDQAVAAKVNSIYPEREFTNYQVQEYVKKNQKLTYGKESLDIKEMFSEELEKISNKAYKEICTSMKSSVDDAKTVLMTGGTGAAYYPYFLKNFEEDYGKNIRVILANKMYLGKKVEPVFAIVLGMHKQLIAVSEAE